MADKVDPFTRSWAMDVYAKVGTAEVLAIEAGMQDYALNGWRKVDDRTPRDELLQTACPNAGLQYLRFTAGDDWRTSTGGPSKPPQYWMPAPKLPDMLR